MSLQGKYNADSESVIRGVSLVHHNLRDEVVVLLAEGTGLYTSSVEKESKYFKSDQQRIFSAQFRFSVVHVGQVPDRYQELFRTVCEGSFAP